MNKENEPKSEKGKYVFIFLLVVGAVLTGSYFLFKDKIPNCHEETYIFVKEYFGNNTVLDCQNCLFMELIDKNETLNTLYFAKTYNLTGFTPQHPIIINWCETKAGLRVNGIRRAG